MENSWQIDDWYCRMTSAISVDAWTLMAVEDLRLGAGSCLLFGKSIYLHVPWCILCAGEVVPWSILCAGEVVPWCILCAGEVVPWCILRAGEVVPWCILCAGEVGKVVIKLPVDYDLGDPSSNDAASMVVTGG